MPDVRSPDLEDELKRFESRLPNWLGNALRAVRRSWYLRIPVGILLMIGGVFGFLPILGFWMVPLGFLLIVQNIPFFEPPLARLFAWINRKMDGWGSRRDQA